MTTAWVLMTALPPTKGHMNLIRFAAEMPVDRVRVLLCTQPSEPYGAQRWLSLGITIDREFAFHDRDVEIRWHDEAQEQDPSANGFWEMWDSIMREVGAVDGDFYVTSEPYGATMAKRLNGIFMPYDPNRELYYTKATRIRDNLIEYFHDILPEFQNYLRTTITVFGAESTGKTTLSKALAQCVNGHWLFEYARPYLELVGPEINVASMEAIWRGQLATQRHANAMLDKPFVVQDTDLFSTVGYWEQPHWTADLGPVPADLVLDAKQTKSDLYIITKSNIPFEQDPIRYGGDRRESPDEYWINVAETYGLNYVVLTGSDFDGRLSEAVEAAVEASKAKAASIYYDRRGL